MSLQIQPESPSPRRRSSREFQAPLGRFDETPRRADKKGVERVLNCLPSKDREKDWRAESAFRSGMAAAAAIPSSKDLREDSWWKVGDQGMTGSCVGWAAADSVLRWHFTRLGRLTKQDRLSVRYLWMAAKETDIFIQRPTTFIDSDGTSLKAALDIARRYGVVKESILPFASAKLYAGQVDDFYILASQLRLASYFALPTDPQAMVAAWRKWIANTGPILTRLAVDSSFMNVTSNGKLDRYKANTAGGGHAVSVVGYTPSTFIIRNSWGTGWGDGGYGHASHAYALAAFTEAYGVLAV